MLEVLHTHHVLSNSLVAKAVEWEPRGLRIHSLGRSPYLSLPWDGFEVTFECRWSPAGLVKEGTDLPKPHSIFNVRFT